MQKTQEAVAKVAAPVLYLPPYLIPDDVEVCLQKVYEEARKITGSSVRVIQADPPYDEDTVEGSLYYMKPYAKDAGARRKLLRKQILTSVASVATDVGSKRPRLIIGVGQGALIALCCSRPLVVEAARRARCLVSEEMQRVRAAWSGLVAIFCISPEILPQKTYTDAEFLLQAVPEFAFEQPQGLVVQVTTDPSKRCRPSFCGAVARICGLECNKKSELNRHAEEVRRLLRRRVPVFFEDDPGSLGMCAVCGKRGSFHRCCSCGMLTHLACLGSTFECPRCSTAPFPEFELAKHGGIKNHKFQKFAKGVLLDSPKGLDLGQDPRPACALDQRLSLIHI